MAMPIFEGVTNQSLKIPCPNRLMSFVLSYYFEEDMSVTSAGALISCHPSIT